MNLHSLSAFHTKHKKRVGRGGKRGTTSGRGQKGQKSRSGRKLRPAERDLILRIPKKRGFRNKPKSEKPLMFSLGELVLKVKPLAEGKTIDPLFLGEIGMISSRERRPIKILSGGEVNVVLMVKGLQVSKGARVKIETAGGRVE